MARKSRLLAARRKAGPGDQVESLVKMGLVKGGGRVGLWLPGGRQDMGPVSRAGGPGASCRWLGGASCWLTRKVAPGTW